jgi:subtilase family serine protease
MPALRSAFIRVVPFAIGLGMSAWAGSTPQSKATQLSPIGMHLLPALQRANESGAANPDGVLGITVSLPFARPAAIQAYADSVSDPKSPMYRRFLTPTQVGERFGLPQARVDAVADYLVENGFTINVVCKNRLAILATATVAQAEAAFHTSIRRFQLATSDETEPSQFVAYATPVRLRGDLASIVLDVSGLETYTRPQRRMTLLNPSLARSLYGTAPLFTSGFTGAGRTLGISSFDGFRSADWLQYIQAFGLPVPAAGAGTNITVVPVSGGGLGAGGTHLEGDLDIQMELGMAPLADIRVYDSPLTYDLIAVLAAEVNDNACDVISDSYAWSLQPSVRTAAHNLHLSMTMQGITYMAASGDSGTILEPYSYPDCEPEVLLVGGTIADVSNPSGRRWSEVAWAGSGGGWSNNSAAFNVRPSWQTGTGVPPVNATNDHRLLPDVAGHSAGVGWGAYQFYSGGTLRLTYDGTSFASPVFAGCLAVAEQDVVQLGGLLPDAAGKRRFGRIQDLVYSMNGRSDVWYDITSGANGTLPDGSPSTCTAGWDTVTGWGAMDFRAFARFASCETGGACTPGTEFCAGDGIDPLVTTPCPCQNFGGAGRGCANSASSTGAFLTAMGSTGPDSVVLNAAGLPPSNLCLFLQGNLDASAGVAYGAGVRCVDGNVKVLYRKRATSSVSAPLASDPPVRSRSAALGDVIPPGATRYYQVAYREIDTNFCSSGAFNVTNGYSITWP